ncbi:prolyl oligopeptidase family protein [Streptomyces sp. NBC_00859]|uniref:prolyl oligopeptidase family serine peptidase n=1 Tax=Streptomyces sp. NBC_00859 TaxID=2903682 RepID=UPI003863B1DB|nr:prolyl oligopeptidase family serine peptidase [Streptomyces sp. NBC_00859]
MSAYPVAPRSDLVEVQHGHRIADPYRWLEDPTDPRTVQWCEQQDALFAEHRRDLAELPRMRDAMSGLLAAGWVSTPSWRGSTQFFMRRSAGQDHAVLMVASPDGVERVLIDPMLIDPSGRTTLDAYQPSQEGDLLAYQLSHGGTEESVLRVMRVDTGDIVDGPIDRLRYSSVAWLPGGEAYYYVRRLDPAQLPEAETQYHRRVWLHRLGSDPAEDRMVFGDGRDKRNYYKVAVSLGGRWLSISASTGTAPRNDVWIAELPSAGVDDFTHLASPHFRTVQEDVDAITLVRFGRPGTPLENRLYLCTDRGAPRGRICFTTAERLAYSDWQDLVPQDSEAVLEEYTILDGPQMATPLMLICWTRHAVSELSVHDLRTGRLEDTVPMPGLGSVNGLATRSEGGHEVWFGYSDFTTPRCVYRYDGCTGQVQRWSSAPGMVKVPDVITRQVSYQSADGTTVRMFVIAPASAVGPASGPDRPRPTILNGYGGFGVSLTPGYSAPMLAWVEAGGIYSVANIRGGGEEGERWHRAGMLENKQKVYDDFHAAADWLTEHGWTTPAGLGIYGGSNGGLLVGVALTQHPEKYGSVVCSAPLLDMIRYEQFGLGATWAMEYGTAADPEQFGWLLSYSPYHQVKQGIDYPAVLLTVFDGDTRVDPLHARKLAAALQHATSGRHPVLYRREAGVGHGARAISLAVELCADTLAFHAAHLSQPTNELTTWSEDCHD